MAEIRTCAGEDLPSVMAFIRDHWARDHILGNHREMMDWQHKDNLAPDRWNWTLATEAGAVQGILGSIPVSKFDPALASSPFTWLALWKVREDAADKALGLRMLQAVHAASPGPVGVLGYKPNLLPLYKALGYETGVLSHHFLCAPGRPQPLLTLPAGVAAPAPKPGRAVREDLDARALEALALDPSAERLPRKTPRYFADRFLRHPIYRYRVHLLRLDGRPAALLATRVAEWEGARALRIVDFLGDERALAEGGSALAGLLGETGCDYADLLQAGLEDATLEACGFRRVDPAGATVVPNYFEPLKRENSPLRFGVRGAKGARLGVFRADGDQDRPSRA